MVLQDKRTSHSQSDKVLSPFTLEPHELIKFYKNTTLVPSQFPTCYRKREKGREEQALLKDVPPLLLTHSIKKWLVEKAEVWLFQISDVIAYIACIKVTSNSEI